MARKPAAWRKFHGALRGETLAQHGMRGRKIALLRAVGSIGNIVVAAASGVATPDATARDHELRGIGGKVNSVSRHGHPAASMAADQICADNREPASAHRPSASKALCWGREMCATVLKPGSKIIVQMLLRALSNRDCGRDAPSSALRWRRSAR